MFRLYIVTTNQFVVDTLDSKFTKQFLIQWKHLGLNLIFNYQAFSFSQCLNQRVTTQLGVSW